MKTELPPIGQYTLQQRLNRDGSSEVWRAYDTGARRTTLIKFFRTDSSDAPASLDNYVHTVERVAALHHPNIAPIYDVHILPSQGSNKAGSLICLATKYVEGSNLADYIHTMSATGKLPPTGDVIAIFTAIAQALEVAHHHGIIHGNLKPSNILLERNNGGLGKALITDFGQAKFPMVKSNAEIPLYLSPEQIKGETPDERSDIYTLGVILYELYTSTLPFQGKRPIAVIMQHVSAPPRPPDLVNPVISPALTQVILRCLAKNPQERFPNVSALIVALANALHVTPPDDLQRSALLDLASGANGADTLPRPRSSSSQASSPPPLFLTKRKSRLGLATIIALLLLLSASLGTFVLLAQGGSAPTNQIVGHAFFVNSNQLNGSSDQGLNDEIQIDLSNIPAPDTGKSYYAWLLGDLNASEQIPLALGRLSVVHGSVHFVYPGDGQHTNLLSFASRFLITEDDTHSPTSDPLLNQSLWRYEAVLPQTPDPTDALHFSMLDHLRHLLVESPEMQARGLNGGLAFWFSNNTAMVSNLSHSLLNDWQAKDTGLLRNQLISILDYLDGSSYISADVPPNTPLLVNAHDIQIALLGPAPVNTDPAGYVFQNEAPPGYVYLIETHVNGALLSPATTPEQHQIAITIAASIASIKQQLTQVLNDTKQLINLPKTQLLSQSSLTLLNDLTTQAQYAYTGQPNPATGNSEGGVLSIYTNLQRLATFDITPYVAPK